MLQFEQMLFHNLDLLGEFEEGLKQFGLSGRICQLWHQWMNGSDDTGDLVNLSPNIFDS